MKKTALLNLSPAHSPNFNKRECQRTNAQSVWKCGFAIRVAYHPLSASENSISLRVRWRNLDVQAWPAFSQLTSDKEIPPFFPSGRWRPSSFRTTQIVKSSSPQRKRRFFSSTRNLEKRTLSDSWLCFTLRQITTTQVLYLPQEKSHPARHCAFPTRIRTGKSFEVRSMRVRANKAVLLRPLAPEVRCCKQGLERDFQD